MCPFVIFGTMQMLLALCAFCLMTSPEQVGKLAEACGSSWETLIRVCLHSCYLYFSIQDEEDIDCDERLNSKHRKKKNKVGSLSRRSSRFQMICKKCLPGFCLRYAFHPDCVVQLRFFHHRHRLQRIPLNQPWATGSKFERKNLVDHASAQVLDWYYMPNCAQLCPRSCEISIWRLSTLEFSLGWGTVPTALPVLFGDGCVTGSESTNTT